METSLFLFIDWTPKKEKGLQCNPPQARIINILGSANI
jgi:hypothetical protein